MYDNEIRKSYETHIIKEKNKTNQIRKVVGNLIAILQSKLGMTMNKTTFTNHG